MRLNNYYIPIFIGIFFLLIACNNNVSEDAVQEINETKSTAVDDHPNEDSELALLMRKMYHDADSIKQLIVNEEGNISQEYIDALERIHTATPTDADVKTPEFSAYTDLMINEANTLFSNETNKKQGFNRLVNRCVECHQSFCPGPIKKINKLKIK